ncbi:hypothetical protein HCN51_56835 [Nonomuraea sp. FMUSA5-5]|uniref:Uncharacterized protein n=1 Tax=Nonomuraea composti TaxID=2720023 RepID=A0ABX1BP19_9ACTN|nr:hypothetical protein [Nonomuraea sp. FMUSA5-5]NJP98792.1 hypothetical protein [Nonomuraea sp. FMUSA5-5]
MLTAIAAFVAGGFLVSGAAHVRPLPVSLAGIVALASVWSIARLWLRIAAEYRRHSADMKEKERLLASCRAAAAMVGCRSWLYARIWHDRRLRRLRARRS